MRTCQGSMLSESCGLFIMVGISSHEFMNPIQPVKKGDWGGKCLW